MNVKDHVPSINFTSDWNKKMTRKHQTKQRQWKLDRKALSITVGRQTVLSDNVFFLGKEKISFKKCCSTLTYMYDKRVLWGFRS